MGANQIRGGGLESRTSNDDRIGGGQGAVLVVLTGIVGFHLRNWDLVSLIIS